MSPTTGIRPGRFRLMLGIEGDKPPEVRHPSRDLT